MEEYRTVRSEATGEFVEKRSRFLCHVKPVTTSEEAVAFINEKKAKYWDAKHNVYAYILRDNNIARYSDDGEPQGTAGMPALEVLKREELYDLVVVITRYFGGILLGAGGLVRAYARGAKEAVEAGGIAVMCLCSEYVMTIDYSQFERMKQVLSDNNAQIGEIEYTNNIKLHFSVKKTEAQALIDTLIDVTNGSVQPEYTGESFTAM